MPTYNELRNRVRSLRGRATTISAGPGLTITITAAGTATWCARLKKNGRATLVRLGSFGDLSLRAAQKAAAELRAEQAAAPKMAMLHASIDEYLAWVANNKSAGRLRTIRLYLNHIRRLCHDEPLEDLIAAHVVHSLSKSDLTLTSQRVCAREIRSMMTWCLNMGYIRHNPLEGIIKLIKVPASAGYPWLPPEELGSGLFTPLTPISDEFRSLILMVALTALRLGNVCNMKWEWLEGYPDAETGVISIPAEDMKMRRPFRVPLTAELVKLLEYRRQVKRSAEYVYPGLTNPHRPYSASQLQNLVHNLSKGRTTLHGLRKTCRTWLSQQEVRYEVAEMILAHESIHSVERIYNYDDYLEARRTALRDWQDFVMQQAGPPWRLGQG